GLEPPPRRAARAYDLAPSSLAVLDEPHLMRSRVSGSRRQQHNEEGVFGFVLGRANLDSPCAGFAMLGSARLDELGDGALLVVIPVIDKEFEAAPADGVDNGFLGQQHLALQLAASVARLTAGSHNNPERLRTDRRLI